MTQRNHFSITLTDFAHEILKQRATPRYGKRDRSATISVIIERYAEICRAHLPELTEEEWTLLSKVLVGYRSWTDPWPIRIDQIPELPGWIQNTAKIHGLSPDSLVKKITSWGVAAKLAVMDEFERRLLGEEG